MTKSASELQALRASLAERLQALHAAASDTADSRRPVELDQTSVGRLSRLDAIQMQEMALAAERRRALELKRIEAAIGRIDSGDYGWCVVCGEAIAPQRLAVDPSIPTCIRCASGSAA